MAPRRAAAVSAANNLAAAAAQNRTVSSSSTAGKQNANTAIKKESSIAATASTSAQSCRPPAPAIPISPIVERLRKTWKFAAICQFLFTFDEAFGMSGFESEALENDLDGSETRVVPDLMRRLLYTLTLNRSIDEENWESHLRLQYLKRQPDEPLLGSTEEPLSWHALPLMDKVGSIHQLCEWQLWDAERFRKLVKNEEDAQIWRIDPIGWDAHDNTYWLFDDNRLWIQHPPPPPPLAKAPPKKSSKKAKAEARREAQKRKREAVADQKVNATPSRARRSLPVETPMRSSPRNRNASGDAQPPSKRQRPARGRATEEWEEVPAELLADKGEEGEADDESDLSDPPEAETLDNADEGFVKVEESTKADVEDGTAMNLDERPEADQSVDQAEAASRDNGQDKDADTEPKKEGEDVWIEFEALVITQSDWEWMSTRFARSKHPDEKALHQLLKETVLPKVMADLAEIEKQRQHELAMANRKRSSRIALKESEKEERERDRIARQRMEEKMAAIRDEEEAQVRREREEKDAVRIREERLREREERLLAREREAMDRALREAEDRDRREKMRELRKLKREQIIANGGHPPDDDSALDSMDTTPAPAAEEDSWELDCEVCGRHGINLEETGEIVCCEECGVWQHIRCWDAFDRRCDRAPRDWEKVDFYCSRCRPPPAGQPRPEIHRAKQATQPSPQHNGHSMTSNPAHASSPSEHAAKPSQLPKATQAQPLQHNAAVSHTAGITNAPRPVPPAYPNSQANPSAPHRNLAEFNGQMRAGYMQTPQLSHQSPAGPPQTQEQQMYPQQQQGRPWPSGGMYPPNQTYTPTYLPSGPHTQNAPSQPVPGQYAPPQQHNFYPRPAPPSLAQQFPPEAKSQPQTTVPRTQPAATVSSERAPSAAAALTSPTSVPASSQNVSSASALQPPSSLAGASAVPGLGSYKGHPSTALSSSSPSSQAHTTTSSTIGKANSVASLGLSQSNGGMHAAQNSPMAVSGVGNGSSPQHQAPMRSPTSSVPHRRPSQPSGSFPMRYATARSPLSGPPQSPNSSTGGLPPVSLPPPARQASPSPAPKQVVQPIRPTQHDQALLHGRQTPQTPQAQAQAHGGVIPATGPGPMAGSLARTSEVKHSLAHLNGSTNPAAQAAGAQQAMPSPTQNSNNASPSPAVSVPQQNLAPTVPPPSNSDVRH